MSRTPTPSSTHRVLDVCRALTVIALVAVASACGGSSGGNTQNPAATLGAALKLQQQGNYGQAAQLYQQVIAAQPNNAYAHYDLGVVDQATSNPVAALAAYGAALTINPKYVPALFNEATIYTTTDPASAISLYRQIVVLQPIASTAYLNLGFLEIKHGAPKQGVSDLAKAIGQDSSLLSRVPKSMQAAVTALASGVKTTPPPTTKPSGTTSP